MSVAVKTSLRLAVVLVLGLTLMSGVASAQSSRDVNNRLNRMENELNTLSRAIFRGQRPATGGSYAADASGGAAAGTEVRMQQLETQIRELTGLVEQQNYQIRQLQEQFEKMAADTELRFQDVQSGNTPSVSSSKPITTAPYTARTLPSQRSSVETFPPERVQPASGTLGSLSDNIEDRSLNVDNAAATYENAFALLKASNFDAAEVAFDKFLSQYPDHVLSPNARYWYGETFYVRGEYERSARIFAEAYQKNPKGSKAADNLLKLGMSLAGMGNKEDACVALLQLEKDTSSGSTPVLRRAQQEISRLGCS